MSKDKLTPANYRYEPESSHELANQERYHQIRYVNILGMLISMARLD